MGSLARDLHQFLMQPRNYPDQPDRIEFLETHVSCLYFTGRFVYKVKKPLNLGFLDFTTLELRRFYCQEEIRLNRRLCPDTYLETVSINLSPSAMAIGGSGKVIEYAVKMAELPAERMLDRLLESDDSELPDRLSATARVLAGFHRKCQVFHGRCDYPLGEMIRTNWRENFSQTGSLPDNILTKRAWSLIQGYVQKYLVEAETVFKTRQDRGWVRDGHGDLHSEHICLTDPIRIFDCIEFNQRFRIADVLADLAFLLMDLDFRKHSGLSELVLRSYAAEWPAWEGDMSLLAFYKIYRAFVRGKVDSFLAIDTEVPQTTRNSAGRLARNYFHLALAYLSRPTLILVAGLMGTGKTTIARRFGGLPGFLVLHSDVLRKQLAGIPPDQPVLDSFGTGLYSTKYDEEVYRLLLDQAIQGLNKGFSVVVDASFADSVQRQRFVRAASLNNRPSLLLALRCDEKTVLERLDRRQEEGKGPSDGRRDLLPLQARKYHSIVPSEHPLLVDTGKEVDYNMGPILCRLAELAGVNP